MEILLIHTALTDFILHIGVDWFNSAPDLRIVITITTVKSKYSIELVHFLRQLIHGASHFLVHYLIHIITLSSNNCPRTAVVLLKTRAVIGGQSETKNNYDSKNKQWEKQVLTDEKINECKRLFFNSADKNGGQHFKRRGILVERIQNHDMTVTKNSKMSWLSPRKAGAVVQQRKRNTLLKQRTFLSVNVLKSWVISIPIEYSDMIYQQH